MTTSDVDQDPGSKKTAKIIRIRIDKNHHNIIFLNRKLQLQFYFTHINNLLIQSIISDIYGALKVL